MIDAGRHVRCEIRSAILIGKFGQSRRRSRGLFPLSRTSASRSPFWNEHPDETVALVAGVTPGIDSINLQRLIQRQRWNQAALPAMSVEAPAVLTAFDLFAVEEPARERHTAMGAGIPQSKRAPLPISSDQQRDLQQRRLFHS